MGLSERMPRADGAPTAEQWREFGSGIARMHLEMDAFRTSHDRYHLDERILIERPLASLAPYAGSGQAAATTSYRSPSRMVSSPAPVPRR